MPALCKGKARASAHKVGKDTADREKPLVAMDYTFFKTCEQEKQTPVLVVKDTKYKAYFAYCVPRKGAADDWIVSAVVKDIERLGHTDIVLKSDGENAIKELQEKIRRRRADGTVMENPPKMRLTGKRIH